MFILHLLILLCSGWFVCSSASSSAGRIFHRGCHFPWSFISFISIRLELVGCCLGVSIFLESAKTFSEKSWVPVATAAVGSLMCCLIQRVRRYKRGQLLLCTGWIILFATTKTHLRTMWPMSWGHCSVNTDSFASRRGSCQNCVSVVLLDHQEERDPVIKAFVSVYESPTWCEWDENQQKCSSGEWRYYE